MSGTVTENHCFVNIILIKTLHRLKKITHKNQGTPLRGDLSRWGFQRGESRFSPLAVGANSLRTNIEIPKV